MDPIMATGRRKTASARVRLVPGTGRVTINGKEIDDYFADPVLKAQVVSPLRLTNTDGRYDVYITCLLYTSRCV